LNRFIDADGVHINVSSVKAYWQTKDRTVRIETNDGDVYDVPPTKANGVLADLAGAGYVVQVIPTTEPLYAVYKDEDGGYFANRVHYLALCADGGIHPTECCDGFLDAPIKTYDGFMGVYHRRGLEEYPGIEVEGESDG